MNEWKRWRLREELKEREVMYVLTTEKERGGGRELRWSERE